MGIAWAAETAKVVIEQPIWTWNFILTACGLPALGWFMSRLITKRDELTEKNLLLWQEGAKERTKALCDKIDTIMRRLETKVDDHECDRIHKALDETIGDIKRRYYT